MNYDFLYEVRDNIATLTLNRPDVLNALTFDVYAQLRDLFEALRYDDAVKVVVITGEGRGFCAGGDVHEIIGELLKRDVKGHLDFTRMTGAVVRNMRLLDKPIIAAVNGMAAGAGAVIAPGRRPAHRFGAGPLRLSLHAGRPDRCRYGRRLPAAANRGAWGAPSSCCSSATPSTPPPPSGTAW